MTRESSVNSEEDKTLINALPSPQLITKLHSNDVASRLQADTHIDQYSPLSDTNRVTFRSGSRNSKLRAIKKSKFSRKQEEETNKDNGLEALKASCYKPSEEKYKLEY